MADMLLGGIVINEILVDPNGSTFNFDTDGNGTADSIDEYVELYNASGVAIDISGLEMWDAGVGHWFTFPPGTILQSGAHAMVMSGLSGGSYPTGDPDDLFFDAGRGSALINNGGDNVVVYDPTNDEFIQATYNGDTLDNPPATYGGFSATATRSGAGEDFGTDTDGLSLQRFYDGSDVFVTDAPTPGITNVCFADGTLIETPHGAVPVETLRAGDTVISADRGPVPIQWVYGNTWRAEQMRAAPNLAPVRIHKGALGPGMPDRDLYLSQQHRVLVQGPIARRIFGSDEVLVAAKLLLDVPGVALHFPDRDLTYYHVMLDQHDILLANALRTESLFLGAEALKSIPNAALTELCAVLNLHPYELGQVTPAPSRPFAKGKKARTLVARHVKNAKPMALAA